MLNSPYCKVLLITHELFMIMKTNMVNGYYTVLKKVTLLVFCTIIWPIESPCIAMNMVYSVKKFVHVLS